MSASGPYPAILLDHFHHPRNQGGVEGEAVVRRGSNPRCGDELEVGITLAGNALASVRFRGRGCSICIASASMMTEALASADRAQALSLAGRMRAWFETAVDSDPPPLPEPLPALAAVKPYPARQRCVLLAWEALAAALDGEAADSHG